MQRESVGGVGHVGHVGEAGKMHKSPGAQELNERLEERRGPRQRSSKCLELVLFVARAQGNWPEMCLTDDREWK